MYSRTESREGQGPRSVRGVDLGQERESKGDQSEKQDSDPRLCATAVYIVPSQVPCSELGNKRALYADTAHHAFM